jgi:hypothetical protein
MKIATRGGRAHQTGQVLIFVLVVMMLLGVTLIAGTGDIATAQHAHERADEAATLGALSGAQAASAASIYAGATQLDTTTAVANCERAVIAVAPEAQTQPSPCALDLTDPQRKHLHVSVIIHVSLPVPVPFISTRVRADRDGDVVAGAQTGT